jgi:putative hydrolase of the HAD superfamily
MKNIKHIVFDWGDTLMRDFPEKPGAMCDWDFIELLPGVEKVLEVLQLKYPLTVATNAGISDTALMRKALHRGEIEHFFSNYFSSKDLGVSKPDPDFFRQVCFHAGFSTNESLLIGNDYRKDIVGAHSAGMTTILFNHAGAEGIFEKAGKVISQLEELLSIL